MARQDIIDIVDYLDLHHIIKKSRPNGNWYTIGCPFHSDGKEKHPSCGVLLEDEYRGGRLYKAGMFHCFACGYADEMAPSIKKLITERSIQGEERDWLLAHIEPFEQGVIQGEELLPPDLTGSLVAKYAVEDLRLKLQQHTYVPEEELAQYRYIVPYMYQRRLTNEVIERYDVGYDANFIFPMRKNPIPSVTFPVRDVQGRTLFIVRRSIEGKFFNMPKQVEKPVYGLYELPKGTSTIIVTESCFNCLTAVVYGYNAVALLGTGTPYQIKQLQRTGARNFVLCLDPDDAGAKGTAKLKKALSQYGMVWTMELPEGKDVNDCTKEEFDLAFNNKI